MDDFDRLQQELKDRLSAFQDKMDGAKYEAWLKDLDDEDLRNEERRVFSELTQVNAAILTNAGAACFTVPATGGISAAVHYASVHYKRAKWTYYYLHDEMCKKELSNRGVSRKPLSDSDMVKTVGKGVLRTIIPKALFS